MFLDFVHQVQISDLKFTDDIENSYAAISICLAAVSSLVWMLTYGVLLFCKRGNVTYMLCLLDKCSYNNVIVISDVRKL